MELSQILEYLTKFGHPRLSHTKSLNQTGWYCKVDMFVVGQGIEFSIESEFQCPTALKAAEQCKQRMEEALTKIAESMPALGSKL